MARGGGGRSAPCHGLKDRAGCDALQLILPPRSVTAAISAGQVSVGLSSSGSIVAARMEAQRITVENSHDAAAVQVALRQRTRDRPGHGVETACGLEANRAARETILPWSKPVRRQGERACLVQGVAQAIETAIEGDEV